MHHVYASMHLPRIFKYKHSSKSNAKLFTSCWKALYELCEAHVMLTGFTFYIQLLQNYSFNINLKRATPLFSVFSFLFLKQFSTKLKSVYVFSLSVCAHFSSRKYS